MGGIVLLETLGVTPDFFHLPRSVDGLTSLRYYLVGGADPQYLRQADRWDIIAVASPLQDPYALLLRQLHVDAGLIEVLEEAEDAAKPRPVDFDGWTEFNGLFSLNAVKLAAFHQFLLDLAEQLPQLPEFDPSGHIYFSSASAVAYVECGIPEGLVERFSGHFRDSVTYRYHPDATIRTRGACEFLRLGRWTVPRFTMSSTLLVALETYTKERVEAILRNYADYLEHQATHPTMDVRMMNGENEILFSRGALRALATLLDERINALASVGYIGSPKDVLQE